MAASARTLTDFLQHSGQVLQELDEREVVLKRRQGDDLIVLSRPHWEAIAASLRILAEAYAAKQADPPDSGTAPSTWFGLPWMSLLHSDDQGSCLRELTETALAAIDSGRFRPLAETLSQWRATALATWDTDRQQERTGQTDDTPLALARP